MNYTEKQIKIEEYLQNNRFSYDIKLYENYFGDGPLCFVTLKSKETDGCLEYITSKHIEQLKKILNANSFTIYETYETITIRFNLNEQELEFCLISNINDYFENITFDDYKLISNDKVFQQFKDIVEQNLQKIKKLEPLEVVSEFTELPVKTQDKLLKEVLYWTENRIKEYREDFGYGINGIILRFIKEKSLVRDLKKAIDKYNKQ